jgi:hypothetical protein
LPDLSFRQGQGFQNELSLSQPRSRHRSSQSHCSVERVEPTARASQESRTDSEIAAGKKKKERTFGGLNLEAAYAAANSIRKSSICFPELKLSGQPARWQITR